MIVEKRLGPTYATPGEKVTADELRRLGCSDALVAYLAPSPAHMALKHPREWFWTDRKWFKGASREVTDEIARFAGGFFCELPLEEQAAMMGIRIVRAPGVRFNSGRGLWQSAAGNGISIDELGLEISLRPGERGSSYEGRGLTAFWFMLSKTFEDMNGYWLGYEPTKRQRYQPGPDYARMVLASVDAVLADPKGIHRRHREYLQTLWRGLELRDVTDWIEIVGGSFIRRYHEHCYSVGANGQGGHPDLTISGSELRFVEVKGKDRMHANQASWIVDIAEPLGLDVTVLKVG